MLSSYIEIGVSKSTPRVGSRGSLLGSCFQGLYQDHASMIHQDYAFKVYAKSKIIRSLPGLCFHATSRSYKTFEDYAKSKPLRSLLDHVFEVYAKITLSRYVEIGLLRFALRAGFRDLYGIRLLESTLGLNRCCGPCGLYHGQDFKVIAQAFNQGASSYVTQGHNDQSWFAIDRGSTLVAAQCGHIFSLRTVRSTQQGFLGSPSPQGRFFSGVADLRIMKASLMAFSLGSRHSFSHQERSGVIEAPRGSLRSQNTLFLLYNSRVTT
ncbi:hypothetical protein ACFE04_026374 [Oxalis oulophora]